MPDIYHIANVSGLSLRSLRRLDKLGFLKSDKVSNPELAKIEMTLRKKNPVSVAEIFYLYKNPKLLPQLGPLEYTVDDIIGDLGDVAGEAMPWDIAAHILDAAMGRPDALETCALWLRQSIEASAAYTEGKPYSYVAVRMLANIPDNLVKGNILALPRAIYKIRKHPVMDGYSFVGLDKRTVFKKPLDL